MFGYKKMDDEVVDEHGPITEDVSKEFDPNL